ncbi:hypothetical protein HERIO_2314 [Hepatospora eriocheir]|uniref:Uncharacterized protein n=1 Tax=Hepatospora eriocheir TaxID=1081669 RepID=A0A1X0Q7D3_9MICR|nr:hypothetical protein HERIO_2314 [Hepatospora eriocheir]
MNNKLIQPDNNLFNLNNKEKTNEQLNSKTMNKDLQQGDQLHPSYYGNHTHYQHPHDYPQHSKNFNLSNAFKKDNFDKNEKGSSYRCRLYRNIILIAAFIGLPVCIHKSYEPFHVSGGILKTWKDDKKGFIIFWSLFLIDLIELIYCIYYCLTDKKSNKDNYSDNNQGINNV